MSKESKNFHVVPDAGHWAVKLAGSTVEPDYFPTRGEAIEHAREIAEEFHVCMVIHDEDGKFEEFDCQPDVRDQHVVFKGNYWAVIAEGGKEISKAFPSKGAAMAHAYDIAARHNVCMLVHDKSGKFKSVTCPADGHPGIIEVIRMKLKY